MPQLQAIGNRGLFVWLKAIIILLAICGACTSCYTLFIYWSGLVPEDKK